MVTNLFLSISANFFSGLISLLPAVNFPAQIETAFISFGSYVSYLNNFINVSTIFVVFNIWILFQLSVFTFRIVMIIINIVSPKKLGF